MKNKEAIQIGLLGEGHLPTALRLTEQSQWNQTERDWRRLLQPPPRGCFGAFLDGQLIGTVTTVVYDDGTGLDRHDAGRSVIIAAAASAPG